MHFKQCVINFKVNYTLMKLLKDLKSKNKIPSHKENSKPKWLYW